MWSGEKKKGRKKVSPSLSCWGCKGWHIVGGTDATSLEHPLQIARGVFVFFVSFFALCSFILFLSSLSPAALMCFLSLGSGGFTRALRLAPPLPGDESRGEQILFPHCLCDSECTSSSPQIMFLFLSFFWGGLHFPRVFKENIATPRGDQMTAIKGNLRARCRCRVSPDQSIFAPWRSETQLISSCNKTTFSSAPLLGVSADFKLQQLRVNLWVISQTFVQPRLWTPHSRRCVYVHRTPRTGGSTVWLLFCWNVETPWCQSASLFVCFSIRQGSFSV